MRALLILFALLPLVAVAQIEDAYTDAEAAAKAKELIAKAKELREEAGKLCGKQGTGNKLSALALVAQDQLDTWPDDHLKYRALFPYHACRQSMINVQSYAQTCALGSYKGEAASYDQHRWKEDTAECAASIENPDLSLKDIQ